MKYLSLKQELKNLAAHIKKLKSTRKNHKFGVPGLSKSQFEYRHKHIAYCLLRGREYLQIENRTANNNGPDWSYIDGIKTLYSGTKEAI